MLHRRLVCFVSGEGKRNVIEILDESVSSSWPRIATHTFTGSLFVSWRGKMSDVCMTLTMLFLLRELKSRPKKSKSRNNSNAGTLKKQKAIKECDPLFENSLGEDLLP